MKPLYSPALAAHSEPRERIYRALLTDPGRDRTVSQLAEQVPDVSVEAVRTTLYLLLGDGVLELVPRQRTLTLRLAGDGAAVLAELLAQWQPVEIGGQLRTAVGVGGRR